MSNYKSEVPEQVSQQHVIGNDNDDIDLLNIIFQLWRGKIIIIATVFAALIIAAIYLGLKPVTWTAKATVTFPTVGQVSNYNTAQSILYATFPQDKLPIAALQSQLLSRFNSTITARAAQTPSVVLRTAQLVRGQGAPLSITLTGPDAEQAQKELIKAIDGANQQVVDDYIADIQRNIEQKQLVLRESLNAQTEVAEAKKQQRLDQQKYALKIAKASKIVRTQLQQADNLSDDTLYLLGSTALQAMIATEGSKPLAFDDIYYQSQRDLLAIQKLDVKASELQSYSYIQQPELPANSDSKKTSLTLAVAVLLGLITGVVIVLVRNQIRHYRAMRAR